MAWKFDLLSLPVVQATRKVLLALIAEGIALNAIRGQLMTERYRESLLADIEAAIKRLNVYWPSQWSGTPKGT